MSLHRRKKRLPTNYRVYLYITIELSKLKFRQESDPILNLDKKMKAMEEERNIEFPEVVGLVKDLTSNVQCYGVANLDGSCRKLMDYRVFSLLYTLKWFLNWSPRLF